MPVTIQARIRGITPIRRVRGNFGSNIQQSSVDQKIGKKKQTNKQREFFHFSIESMYIKLN